MERDTTEETATIVTSEGGRRRTTEDPLVIRKDYNAGREYHMGSRGTEESISESAERSGDEKEELVSEEESKWERPEDRRQ